ncbi:Putative aminotransferase class IV [Methylocystis sp. SC2]|nr:Putative aminotransferase class IV [Methylocystis sp. SC2]
MSDIAYVNGAYIPIDAARVSILDRGFLFADGVYEVAAVIGGRLIDNQSHLSRLERSLAELRIGSPFRCRASRKLRPNLSQETV